MPWGAAIRKELRALAPIWLAGVGVMVAGHFAAGPARLNLFNAALIFGAVALGAMTFGHEYLHGTLGPWLSQPASRSQLAASKLLALVLAMAAYLAVAAVVSGSDGQDLRLTYRVLFPLVALYAIAVTPMFTIVGRGPLAGIVLTLATPVIIFVAHLVFSDNRVPELSLYGAAVVSGLIGWQLMMRLEAIDNGSEVTWRSRSRGATGETRPSPLWSLIVKELHLQQLTFIVAGLSFAAILLPHWMRPILPEDWLSVSYPLSLLHLAVVPVLAGSLASAEERRLGTLESQVLQPVAAWKQWAVKTAVVIGVSLVVGVGLIAAFSALDSSADVAGLRGRDLTFESSAELTAALAIVAMYVSSLASSGLRAVVACIALVIAAAAVFPVLGSAAALTRPVAALVRLVDHAELSIRWQDALRLLSASMGLVAIAGMGALLFRLGLSNHRSAERGGRRAARQALIIVACLAIAWAAPATVGAVSQRMTAVARYSPAERAAISATMTRMARWRHDLEGLTAGFDGRVGVCIGDGLLEACISGASPFPMQSVMKLPVAVAVLDGVDHGKWHLADHILVTKRDLSVFVQPIAKLVGPKGYDTTIDDLIRRAIVDSDSAATDILLAKLGGPAEVRRLMNYKAVLNVRVDRDERHLQTEILGLEWRDEFVDPAALDRAIAAVPAATREAAFDAYLRDARDTATPMGMVVLLERLAQGRLLSPSSTARLLEILRETKTFPDRLKAGVPDGWTIGHKTGTSGDWKGVTAATNDVGIITGPNGETISIAVFIAESRAPEADRAALMARIARLAVDGYK
jgi:beta-lactamase class A